MRGGWTRRRSTCKKEESSTKTREHKIPTDHNHSHKTYQLHSALDTSYLIHTFIHMVCKPQSDCIRSDCIRSPYLYGVQGMYLLCLIKKRFHEFWHKHIHKHKTRIICKLTQTKNNMYTCVYVIHMCIIRVYCVHLLCTQLDQMF